jgi:hypothetical protein
LKRTKTDYNSTWPRSNHLGSSPFPPLYQAFGLAVRSDDLELPELLRLDPPPPQEPITELHPLVIVAHEPAGDWSAASEAQPSFCHSDDNHSLWIAPNELRLSIGSVGHFRIVGGQRIGWCRAHPRVNPSELRTYLLGSAFGALLIQRGLLVLHGNALEREGQAIVCLGASGAGKSTLACALMGQGWSLLADDLVAVTPEGMVLPGIPRIKLWEDAMRSFGWSPEQAIPVASDIAKYLMPAIHLRPAQAPARLAQLYLLQREPWNGISPPRRRAIGSEKVAMAELLNQLYRPSFVRGLGYQGSSFMALAQVMRQAPLTTLAIPDTIADLIEALTTTDLLSCEPESPQPSFDSHV